MEEENWKEEESVTRDLKRKKKTSVRTAPDNLEGNGHPNGTICRRKILSPFYLNVPISSTTVNFLGWPREIDLCYIQSDFYEFFQLRAKWVALLQEEK